MERPAGLSHTGEKPDVCRRSVLSAKSLGVCRHDWHVAFPGEVRQRRVQVHHSLGSFRLGVHLLALFRDAHHVIQPVILIELHTTPSQRARIGQVARGLVWLRQLWPSLPSSSCCSHALWIFEYSRLWGKPYFSMSRPNISLQVFREDLPVRDLLDPECHDHCSRNEWTEQEVLGRGVPMAARRRAQHLCKSWKWSSQSNRVSCFEETKSNDDEGWWSIRVRYTTNLSRAGDTHNSDTTRSSIIEGGALSYAVGQLYTANGAGQQDTPGEEEKHRTERARPMRIRASSVLWEKEQTLDWTSSLRSQHESPAARQGSLTSLHLQHLTAQSTVVSAHKLKNCVNAPPLGDVHTLSLHPQLRFTARDRWNTHPEQSEPKGWNLHRLVRFKGLWLHPQRRFSDFSQLHSQHEQRHVGRFARRKHPHPLTRNYKAGCPRNTNKTTRSTSYPAVAA